MKFRATLPKQNPESMKQAEKLFNFGKAFYSQRLDTLKHEHQVKSDAPAEDKEESTAVKIASAWLGKGASKTKLMDHINNYDTEGNPDHPSYKPKTSADKAGINLKDEVSSFQSLYLVDPLNFLETLNESRQLNIEDSFDNYISYDEHKRMLAEKHEEKKNKWNKAKKSVAKSDLESIDTSPDKTPKSKKPKGNIVAQLGGASLSFAKNAN